MSNLSRGPANNKARGNPLLSGERGGELAVANALDEAFDELKKVELLDERDQMREREATTPVGQAELDAIA